LLKRLKEKGGTWEKVLKSFPDRTARACKNRYNNHLNEGEKKAPGVSWSKENELLLWRLKAKGGTWEQIANSFPGRTSRACETRYNSYLNKGEKRAIEYRGRKRMCSCSRG
jgi:hypothetical protein